MNKESIIMYLILAVAIGYVSTWMVFLRHFDAKFNQCKQQWEEAYQRRDFEAQKLYFDAEMLAHSDTRASPFWPLIVHRWSADYVAEARVGMGQQ